VLLEKKRESYWCLCVGSPGGGKHPG
jgi:hypothetical protein